MKPEVLLIDHRASQAVSRCARLAQTLVLASLVAACGGGGGGGNAAPVAPGSSVAISGTATYDFVPTNADGRGLNYGGTTQRPIRGATVELLNASGAVLASTTTSETGTYGLTLTSAQAVTVRVRAEIKRSGTANGDRDFTVRDNTSASGDALYVLDSPAFTPTAATTIQNLNAASGWGGNGYTGTRSAAPFAILDVVYAAQAKVATADPAVALPALRLFWSPNNQPASGSLAAGNIGTSFFTFDGSTRALYLLGRENTDTDEYDDHVVAHEFGHYLQSAVSRDDSPGGSHTLSDRLDMRLAFSEGWGNAWSGMALGSPVYADSSGNRQSSGFSLNVSAAPGSNLGWYSEASLQYLLWSAHQDPGIGFPAVYAALRGLRDAPTFTSPYSFSQQLKAAAPATASAINSLWGQQAIVTQDALGTGETNAGGNVDNLPVYRQHTAAIGVAQQYCVNTSAATGNPSIAADVNKLGRHVFILFTASGARTLTVVRNGGNFAGASDPDLVLVKSDGSKQAAEANTTSTQTESLATTLPTGTHVVALEDFNLTSPSTSCFNFTVN